MTFRKMTYLLGPNGAGKTTVLQVLARLFGFDPAQRRIRRTDFNIPVAEAQKADTRTLWIEAEFEFPELSSKSKAKHATIPVYFAHLQLPSADGVARVRFRLTATLDEGGDIEEKFEHIFETDDDDEPTKTVPAHKAVRSNIQVHYLPARRDPSDHIAYTANSLLGRVLRAAKGSVHRRCVFRSSCPPVQIDIDRSEARA
ncbi:AAA family ATPase [Lysobacter sp. GCM10012299]|uniref:AAA family ATPase n=1 Tax=Lysobacter sp. GCM10012299 TaxID=3317333 RepID=UPI0036063551